MVAFDVVPSIPLFAALPMLYLLFVYWRLYRLHHRCRLAFATMEQPIRRRHELVPRLLARAELFMAPDDPSLVLLLVTRSRAESVFQQAQTDEDEKAVQAIAQSELALKESLHGLLGLDLPEWRADAEVQKLSVLLRRLAKEIDTARIHWNDAAILFNLRREAFPDRFIATLARLREAPVWEQTNHHGLAKF